MNPNCQYCNKYIGSKINRHLKKDIIYFTTYVIIKFYEFEDDISIAPFYEHPNSSLYHSHYQYCIANWHSCYFIKFRRCLINYQNCKKKLLNKKKEISSALKYNLPTKALDYRYIKLRQRTKYYLNILEYNYKLLCEYEGTKYFIFK
jgi:hypothetical protein